jgi:plastocyanin
VVALSASVAPAARADERVVAAPVSTYATPSVTIDQGEALYFRNLDLTSHDVVARNPGPDGKPLFATALIGPGGEAFVEGSQYLTTGSYAFFCTIHPGMDGTLDVSGAGTPAARPGAGSGGSASASPGGVALALKILDRSASKVRDAGKLRVRAQVDGSAHVALKATTRRGGRRVTVARGQRHFGDAGRATVRLKLTGAGRRALRPGSTIAVSGTATDSSGAKQPAAAKRRLGD